MFENFILGPICIVTNEASRKFHLNQLYIENWVVIGEITKGEFFEEIKSKLVPDEQKNLTSIIISRGFYKTYQA